MRTTKRILAISILSAFLFYSMAPALAIVDNNKDTKKQNKVTVLDRINYDWWQKIDDPYLQDYIMRAAQNNYDVKTATLKLEQAKINVMAVRSGQFPTIAIGASPAIAKLPGSDKTMGSFAVPRFVQYELDLFGKNWDKTKSAKESLKGMEYQTTAADIAIISAVAGTYYAIVRLDKTIELQEKIVSDRNQIYNLMKLSNIEGIASTQDKIQSEKGYILAQNNLIELQKARQEALNSLAVLIGDSPVNSKDYQRISYDKLSSEFDIPNEISSDIIINRPDYKALEHQLKAAGIDIRVAKKEFLPTIDIIGLSALVATSMASSMNFTNSLALAGANITLPLFTGLKKVANFRFNKNKYRQILEQYQKTNLVAIQEVNDALYNYKSDNEKLKNNIKAHDIQSKDYGFAKAKYDSGIISKLDLLQQEETLLYTQQLTVAAKMDCYMDKIALYKSTGAQL